MKKSHVFVSLLWFFCWSDDSLFSRQRLPRGVASAQATRGIPGATQTLNGYDTELGTDPICWTSRSASSQYEGQEAYPFPNPLVANFSIAGNITLLNECPQGNHLMGYAPVNREKVLVGKSFQRNRLRTRIWHNFTIHATFNLTSLEHAYFVSDMGPTVAFQVILCINGVSGFCSPFIHEEANERIVRQGGEVPTIATGDRHGETHVHSPKVFRNLTFADGPIYELDVDVPMLVNHEADFYAIAAVQFFVGDTPFDSSRRWDMANALVDGHRLIAYQEPAEILDVPAAVLAFCHVLRGASTAVIAFLLLQTVYHRNHQVLRLSQQPFLVVFLVAALVATVGSVLLRPKNDFFCRWSKLVVLSSLQLVLAVTTGRMWRINSVISPLLAKTLRRKESRANRSFRRLFQFLRCSNDRNPRQSINVHREFKPFYLTVAICVLTIPQVILQLAASIWQPESLEIEFNYDQSVGRKNCTNDLDMRQSMLYYGFGVFVCLILLLMFMARMTRHLPSLFNETQVIFDTAVSSLVVLALGIAIVLITDDPTTSPAIAYLTWSVQVFYITVNASCRIMLPKLQMVWRGETVLVSKLVAEHAKTIRADDDLYIAKNSKQGKDNERFGSAVRVTGLKNQQSGSRQNDLKNRIEKESDSQDLAWELENFEKKTSHSEGATEPVTENGESTPGLNNREAPGFSVPEAGSNILVSNGDESLNRSSSVPSLNRRVGFKDRGFSERKAQSGRRSESFRQSKVRGDSLIIRRDQAPPKRLILKMYDLQANLADVNQRLLSGMAVSEEEWEKLRRLSTRMGDTFHDVLFAWKPNEMSASMEESWDLVEGENEGSQSQSHTDFPDEEVGEETTAI